MRKLVVFLLLFFCGLIAAYHLAVNDSLNGSSEDAVNESLEELEWKAANESDPLDKPQVLVLNGSIPDWYSGLLTYANGFFSAPLSTTKLHEYLVRSGTNDFTFVISINDTSKLGTTKETISSFSIRLFNNNGTEILLKILWEVTQSNLLIPTIFFGGHINILLNAPLSVTKYNVSISTQGSFLMKPSKENADILEGKPLQIPEPRRISLGNQTEAIEFEMSADQSGIFSVFFDDSAIATVDKTPGTGMAGQYIAIIVVGLVIALAVPVVVGVCMYCRYKKKHAAEKAAKEKPFEVTENALVIAKNAQEAGEVACEMASKKTSEMVTAKEYISYPSLTTDTTGSKQSQTNKDVTSKEAGSKQYKKEQDKAATPSKETASKVDKEGVAADKAPSGTKEGSKADVKALPKKDSEKKKSAQSDPPKSGKSANKAGCEKKVAPPPPSSKKA